MSYDVTVGTQEFNYTYNMGKFFWDFGVHPVQDMDGKSTTQVLDFITAALKRLTEYEMDDLCNDYDSPNGWGSVEGATRFLFDIYLACLMEVDVYKVEAT